MIHQLNPPVPLLTPKGSGVAHLVIDYGPEFDLHWTVFLDGCGECWTFRNRDVRATKNITLGRTDVAMPTVALPMNEMRAGAKSPKQHVNGA